MEVEVQTLINPAVLDIPEVRQELLRWSNIPAFHQELAARMASGGAAVIVGTSDQMALEGASIVVLPGSFTEDSPWVIHFHNRGPRVLTHKMVLATVDFIRRAGYTTYKAFNQSGMPDKRWLRAFKLGGKPNFIGSAYFFDLKEGISDGIGNSDHRGGGVNRPRAGAVRRNKAKTAKPAAVPELPAKHAHRHDKARVPGARADGGGRLAKRNRRRKD